MKHNQDTKIIGITPPAAKVDNAAFVTAAIDTLGFAQLDVYVYLGDLDIALTACKIRESDSSDMSGANDIDGADASVSPHTLPSATADNTISRFSISLQGGRKRYIDLSLSGGDGSTGTFACAWGILSRPLQVSRSTAAMRGITGVDVTV